MMFIKCGSESVVTDRTLKFHISFLILLAPLVSSQAPPPPFSARLETVPSKITIEPLKSRLAGIFHSVDSEIHSIVTIVRPGTPVTSDIKEITVKPPGIAATGTSQTHQEITDAPYGPIETGTTKTVILTTSNMVTISASGTTSATIPTKAASSSKSGPIVGIAVGLVVCIGVFSAVFFFRRKKSRESRLNQEKLVTSSVDPGFSASTEPLSYTPEKLPQATPFTTPTAMTILRKPAPTLSFDPYLDIERWSQCRSLKSTSRDLAPSNSHPRNTLLDFVIENHHGL